MKKYTLLCDLLSPIHIGVGDEIDPLTYIIEGENLYKISLKDFVSNMNNDTREKFENLINKNDLIGMRSFITETIDIDRDSSYSVAVDPTVRNLYAAKIDDIQNQLLINPEHDERPLIPGSSIKGAIRTAIVSELAKASNLPKPKNSREESQFESKVLGYKDGKDDPFRGIKIRDAFLEKNSTIIRQVINVSKDGVEEGALKVNDIQMIYEVTHSMISGRLVNFETELLIDESLFSAGFLSKNLALNDIIRSCTKFYQPKILEEHEKFYKGSCSEPCSKQLIETPLDGHSLLLRVGRFSGVESVTLDKYRNPKPFGNKNIWGTTRNLAEGLYPMGWLKINILEK